MKHRLFSFCILGIKPHMFSEAMLATDCIGEEVTSSYLLSCVRLFVTPWTVALQSPLSMEFSRQDYWSG